MEVYVNEINGIADAICSLYMSKRNLTREKELDIRSIVEIFPELRQSVISHYAKYYPELQEMLSKVRKYGVEHTTLLRFIDISCTVYGLHRGAQDDFDAHAKRLESRIVRSSTRLAKFQGGEKSNYYVDKILTTDEVAEYLNMSMPDRVYKDGKNYVKAPNGYILEDEKDNQDVERGLYMLSIPSNFIFKCNLVDFAHIVYMRDKYSHAAPELRQMIESILEQLNKRTNGFINREFLYEIERVTINNPVD